MGGRQRLRRVLEIINGYDRDVVALYLHEQLVETDVRANLPPSTRDKLAAKHDLRILAKVQPFARSERVPRTAEDRLHSSGQWRDLGRIAVVTDDPLARMTIQFLAPFFHGSVRIFPNTQGWKARAWLQGLDRRY